MPTAFASATADPGSAVVAAIEMLAMFAEGCDVDLVPDVVDRLVAAEELHGTLEHDSWTS